jgi:multidrug efflux pump subunit AcrA (membrane-fusion protein)
MNAYKNIYQIDKESKLTRIFIIILIVIIVVLFLPWTQNIKARGNITTLQQEQRRQEVNTIIAGKVAKWWVKEGDSIEAGDTIMQLSEVKVEYLDPLLLEKMRSQIQAKTAAVEGYGKKGEMASKQEKALAELQLIKLDQLKVKQQQQQLKLISDSIELVAQNNELQIAKRQIDAAKNMLDEGVISLVDFERSKVAYQNAFAKKMTAENKYAQSKQETLALQFEQRSILQDYNDKIAKVNGEKYSASADQAAGIGDLAKLENNYANYDVRNKLYYIIAPQSGQITKAKKAGIGEYVKEGEMIVEIVPKNIQYAVELFVEPMDLPLISKGQKVRFIFDGFPAIVFSGWPNSSYGTFGGVITVIENGISDNGKFRVLVSEDPSEKSWPKQLRFGGGANGIALLKDVSIGYELWRNINGFPPEYYQAKVEKKNK